MSYALFEEFENGNYVSQDNLKLIENFICGNLNGWSPNKSHYYTQWNYLTKLYDICLWRKKNGFRTFSFRKRRGNLWRRISKLFADKKHKNCGYEFFF